MKLFLLVLSFLISLESTAQTFSITYVQKDQTRSKPLDINKDVAVIDVVNNDKFQQFSVATSGLLDGDKFEIFEGTNLLGTFTKANPSDNVGDGTTDLSNKVLKIYLSQKNEKKLFAEVILRLLPNTDFNVFTQLNLQTPSIDPCNGCVTENTSYLEYDFSKRSIENKGTASWTFGNSKKPTVGKAYYLKVINFNPFRDSVIIGSETTSFNTDVPPLFTQAFFPSQLNQMSTDVAKIISAILKLQVDLQKMKAILEIKGECHNVCDDLASFKQKVETYFTSQCNNCPGPKQDLIKYLIGKTSGAPKLYRDQVLEVLNDYYEFINTRNYFIYEIPQVQNVDQYIFNLSIIPKKGKTPFRIIDKQPISVNTIGGVKFDFSSGLFITGLTDDRFHLRPDSVVGNDPISGNPVLAKRNQIIQQRNRNNNDFGVAALMHVYPRISRGFNIAASIGAGLSIGPNPSIRYLGGGSVLLGRSGRLVLTVGIAAGFVENLADGYADMDYVTSDLETKNLTKKSFNTSRFGSLTFNIPLFKSKISTAGSTSEESPSSSETPAKSEEKKKD